MAAGTISLVAVLRDARSFDKLRSALLRTRADGLISICFVSIETLY
jgi:hypothetical protein